MAKCAMDNDDDDDEYDDDETTPDIGLTEDSQQPPLPTRGHPRAPHGTVR